VVDRHDLVNQSVDLEIRLQVQVNITSGSDRKTDRSCPVCRSENVKRDQIRFHEVVVTDLPFDRVYNEWSIFRSHSTCFKHLFFVDRNAEFFGWEITV